MYTKTFLTWVEHQLRDLETNGSSYPAFSQKAIVNNDRIAGIIIQAIHTPQQKGIAKCHELDVYSSRIGVAIAWARFKAFNNPQKLRRIQYIIDNMVDCELVRIGDISVGEEFCFTSDFKKPMLYLRKYYNGSIDVMFTSDYFLNYKENKKYNISNYEDIEVFVVKNN